jgi:hypothetical protein
MGCQKSSCTDINKTRLPLQTSTLTLDQLEGLFHPVVLQVVDDLTYARAPGLRMRMSSCLLLSQVA